MGVKVTNNAYGTLSAGISTSDTTITLDSGQGARFPTLGAGDYFFATLIDTSNNLEIVKVTARSSDSMTVTRGQDNTTATAFAIGDRFELRPVAALFEDIINNANVDGISSSSTSGTALTIDSSNNLTASGTVTIDGGGDDLGSDTAALTISSGYINITHDEGLIAFDNKLKTITSNDGFGNFNISYGVDDDGLAVTGDNTTAGSARLEWEGADAAGKFHLGVSDTDNSDGDTVYYDSALRIAAGKNGLTWGYGDTNATAPSAVNTSVSDVFHSNNAGQCVAWAAFEQKGTHSFIDSFGFSGISDQGTGLSRLTFSSARPNDTYAVVSAENGQNDSGVAGGPFANTNGRPGNSSYTDYESRTYSNSSADKYYVGLAVFDNGGT